jgi:hypothetical protein
MTNNPFKKCPLCGKTWATREEFLADRHTRLNGYQCNSKRVREGLPANGILVFTHFEDACGTTLAVPASSFRDDPLVGNAIA